MVWAVTPTRQRVAGVERGAPTARLELVMRALRCLDVLIDTVADGTQAVIDQVFGKR
jgi:hypothetical protein